MTAARDGMPISVRWRQRWLTVLQVEEVWRVAEAWWRDELLARTYYQLSVEDGRLLTLFHDDTQTADCGWFEQRY